MCSDTGFFNKSYILNKKDRPWPIFDFPGERHACHSWRIWLHRICGSLGDLLGSWRLLCMWGNGKTIAYSRKWWWLSYEWTWDEILPRINLKKPGLGQPSCCRFMGKLANGWRCILPQGLATFLLLRLGLSHNKDRETTPQWMELNSFAWTLALMRPGDNPHLRVLGNLDRLDKGSRGAIHRIFPDQVRKVPRKWRWYISQRSQVHNQAI